MISIVCLQMSSEVYKEGIICKFALQKLAHNYLVFFFFFFFALINVVEI